MVRAIGVTPWFLYVPRSEWERKRDVRASPSYRRTATAILLLALLGVIAAVAALRRRTDLSTAALMALVMRAALAANAANTPRDPLLAGTLGYTMWWGSQLGLWVWLVVGYALASALAWAARRAWSLAAPRLPRSLPGAPGPRVRTSGWVALVTCGLLATAAVGDAVAGTQRADSHVREYSPTTTIGQALVKAIPPGATIDYELGPLDLATQPIEPAIRFWLVKHGDRPLADGSRPRLGPYYQLGNHSYQWIVYLGDGGARRRGLRLLARVRFRDQWGAETLSAWIGRPRAARVRPATGTRRRPPGMPAARAGSRSRLRGAAHGRCSRPGRRPGSVRIVTHDDVRKSFASFGILPGAVQGQGQHEPGRGVGYLWTDPAAQDGNGLGVSAPAVFREALDEIENRRTSIEDVERSAANVALGQVHGLTQFGAGRREKQTGPAWPFSRNLRVGAASEVRE